MRTLFQQNHCRLSLVLAVVFVCLLSFTCGAQTPGVETGAAELKKGNYENAIRLLNAELVRNPADTAVQANLLHAFYEIGRYTDLETSARKFLLKNPDAGLVRYQFAEVLVATGRYSEAIAEFERAAADLEKSKQRSR